MYRGSSQSCLCWIIIQRFCLFFLYKFHYILVFDFVDLRLVQSSQFQTLISDIHVCFVMFTIVRAMEGVFIFIQGNDRSRVGSWQYCMYILVIYIHINLWFIYSTHLHTKRKWYIKGGFLTCCFYVHLEDLQICTHTQMCIHTYICVYM